MTIKRSPSVFSLEASGSLLLGALEIISGAPSRFSSSGRVVSFKENPTLNGFRIATEGERIEVTYGQPCHAYRAIGFLLGKEDLPASGVLEETCCLSRLGVMLDVSRNAVLRVDTIKSLFRRFALMGINSVQLYMEDIYALDGESFFGYARGSYSTEELREIDDYGNKLGIEVVPCIQTLGHLEQVLQWPIYSELVDVPGVLLVGEAKTYQLIGKMLDTVSSCFRTRRIHIGMDEAHGVGQGRYRKLHGDNRSFDVLNDHLNKVTALCQAGGLQPMMWSDMYFRIGSSINDYYDRESIIPPDVASKIPASVDLVYWDYYHNETEFYEEWIDRHRALGKKPIFATGVWNWGRLWTRLPTAFAMISAGMKAASKKELTEAFTTLWGDDGTECDPFSTLPAIQFFAEQAYVSQVSLERLESRFFGSCGSELVPFLLGSEVDAFPGDLDRETIANFGKWILWHDPVLSFLEKCIPKGMTEHYETLASKLKMLTRDGESVIHLEFVTKLADVLAGKSKLHVETRCCYREKDIKQLHLLLEETLPTTIQSIQELHQLHHKIWHSWYKPFGWEVLDRRYGGILARLESLRRILVNLRTDMNLHVPEFHYETNEMTSNIFFDYGRTSFSTTWK